MYKIKYMDKAKNNLLEIEQHLDRIDSRLTNKIFSSIDGRIQELKDMPFRWPKYHDNPKYRTIGVSNYLVFYIVDDEKKVIEIHRILHGARDIKQLFERG